MREIVLDTETTGLDPGSGHRIVEIGCIELRHLLPTGRSYHCYCNPERAMPEGARRIHGLSEEFLSGQPVFAEVADGFLTFLAESPLVIHNARFDLGFVNAELARLDRPPIESERAIDTVALARRRFPGAQVNLDALCRRFAIDLSERTKHGALLDAELLAAVYLELKGGKQPGLDLATRAAEGTEVTAAQAATGRTPRRHTPSATEIEAHEALLAKIKNPLWKR